VEPRLPVPDELSVTAEELEGRVLEASLDLRAMHHGIMALGHEVGLKRLEVMFPEGNLGAKAEREPDGTWSVGPVTSFSLPVFNFGQGASAEARARLEQAYERYTDLAVRIRRSARSAFVESEALGNNSRYLLEVVVPLRSRITEQTQRQFNAMQLGVFQLLEARRREFEAGRRYVETLRDHWVARTRVEALLLGRLPEARFGISGPDSGSTAAMAGNGNSGGH
jgi:outer membrane protein TolC